MVFYHTDLIFVFHSVVSSHREVGEKCGWLDRLLETLPLFGGRQVGVLIRVHLEGKAGVAERAPVEAAALPAQEQRLRESLFR